MRPTPPPHRATSEAASPDTFTPWVTCAVPARLSIAAADALVGRGHGAGRRFLEAARAQGMDLSCFWCTLDRGRERVRHACAVVPGAGRTAMMFSSSPRTPAEAPEVAALLDGACAAAGGPLLVQALLEPGEDGLERSLGPAGFARIGVLQYLKRPWADAPAVRGADGWPAGVTVRRWGAGDDPLLREALEASYEQTLDCPELHGLRRTEDVIASHRATGRWDPRLWWLVFEGGRARGALLLNPCPEHDSTELVYLGLAPSLRGRGLGRRLLATGVEALCGRPHRAMACAVDARNAPARRLYEDFGFRLFAERAAFVRALAAPGREG